MLYGKNSCKQASMLIELILSVFIIAMIFPAVILLLKHISVSVLCLYDSRVALQRISSAESLLDYPIYNCGYAMPTNTIDYQKAFNYQQTEPFSWDGPISVSLYNGKSNAMLKIAYGKRENAMLATGLHCNLTTRAIQLTKNTVTGNIIASSIDFPQKVQSYILLSSMSIQPVPISVRNISGKFLLLGKTIYNDFTISMNDPVYLFCAMKIYTENNILYSRDYRTLGVVPRVDGVADMRFFVDKDNNCIIVYTLVNGCVKIKNGRDLQLINFVKDESNYLLINEWENIKSPYTLYASKKTWRLINCIK